MISIFCQLATEAPAESGFGFNTNILETNIINLAILLGILIFYGSKVIGNTLSTRSAEIAAEIQEAEARAKQAAAALADGQQKLAQAQAEAEKIRGSAQETAQKAKAEILAQGKKEIEKIRAAAVQELDSDKAKVIAQLKQQIAAAAIERVESQLKEHLDRRAQEKLVDHCITQLGGGS